MFNDERHIYLASSWENRYSLRAVRDKLVKLGNRVTSTWIDVGEVDYSPEVGAIRDIVDLERADTLVFWPDDLRKKTSGKYVEFGYAIASGHDIFIIDPETSTCIFTKLQMRSIVRVDTFDELYDALRS